MEYKANFAPYSGLALAALTWTPFLSAERAVCQVDTGAL